MDYLFYVISALRLCSNDPENMSRFLIHKLQLLKSGSHKKASFDKFLSLSKLGQTTQYFKVVVSTSVSMHACGHSAFNHFY